MSHIFAPKQAGQRLHGNADKKVYSSEGTTRKTGKFELPRGLTCRVMTTAAENAHKEASSRRHLSTTAVR